MMMCEKFGTSGVGVGDAVCVRVAEGAAVGEGEAVSVCVGVAVADGAAEGVDVSAGAGGGVSESCAGAAPPQAVSSKIKRRAANLILITRSL